MKQNDKKININTNLPMIPIGSIANHLKVTQKTLRTYDEEGILCPERTLKNTRSYSLDDLERAKVILFLTRNLALNLSGVKIILSMLEESKIAPQDYMDYIQKIAKRAKIDSKIQKSNIEKASKKGRKKKGE